MPIPPANTLAKQYLGDGVYAEDDGYHIVLTTENGISITNTICLDQQVVEALVGYIAALATHVAKEEPPRQIL